MILFAAACSHGDEVPVDLSTPVSAVPSGALSGAPGVAASDAAPAASVLQNANELRPISAGDGNFPTRSSQSDALELHELPTEVGIGGGRIWVPWPPYPRSLPSAQPASAGSHSALAHDASAGLRYVVDQRQRWDSIPAYLPAAHEAFENANRVARRRAGTDSAWELVVDTAGHEYETHIGAEDSVAYDHVSLCPPHPTPQVLGLPPGALGSASERERADASTEAFILGMRSPGGRPMHSWGTTVNEIAKLLVYSPGEPMELALGGHSLADVGFFPGDWSAQAKAWLTRRAAQGAVSDSLIGHAAASTGPQTLWEACGDLATITPGVYTESHRTRQLESLWARGLRLEFTTPPVERAWVADISSAGHALAVVCHQPGQSFLVDASTEQRLDSGTVHRAQVEAMWLTWSRLSYRVLRNSLFDGGCGSDAFASALQWLDDQKQAHAATIDWTAPRAWGSGVRSQWVSVREWVSVPQREVWEAHRDHSWHLRFWCEIGIPVGVLIDGELLRPKLSPHCSAQQWTALEEAAAAAPEVTWELSATVWEPGTSWHERMYLSPFKSLEQILGCTPDAHAIAVEPPRPVEHLTKKPWPPGSLPGTPEGHGYRRPMPPCPRGSWPSPTDEFWWPEAAPLVGTLLGAASGASSAAVSP